MGRFYRNGRCYSKIPNFHVRGIKRVEERFRFQNRNFSSRQDLAFSSDGSLKPEYDGLLGVSAYLDITGGFYKRLRRAYTDANVTRISVIIKFNGFRRHAMNKIFYEQVNN